MDAEQFNLAVMAISGGLIVGFAGIVGWIYTTRLRIKNGYPLSGAWGQSVYPKTTTQEIERIKLLSQENAQLQAELGSVKDRLATVERIVTDGGFALTHQIEALRVEKKDVQ
jgi:ABC-type phosphate transport system auxiliary subunit